MHVLLLALCCTIGGSVHATSGVPLASALIELRGVAGTEVRRGATDVAGNFSLPAVPGRYRLAASARGYASVIVAVDAQNDVRVELSLEALDSPRLRQISLVTVDGRLAPVRGAVPALTLTRPTSTRLAKTARRRFAAAARSYVRASGRGRGERRVRRALRGPDPSESLIALDGQLLNDGNTGDLDLSRLPVAAFSAIDLNGGLGPEDRAAAIRSAVPTICSPFDQRANPITPCRCRAGRSAEPKAGSTQPALAGV